VGPKGAFLLVSSLFLVAAADGAARELGRLPLWFEPNQGQAAGQVKYLSRGRGYSLLLAAGEVLVGSGDAALRMRLLGANPAPALIGEEPLPGKSNYFLGKDPARWRTDIPHYAKVRYREVYPGIDIVFYGHQGRLEYDLVVRPGAQPSRIQLQYRGARQLRVDAQGDLVIQTAAGEIRQFKPVIYQEEAGGRRVVEGRHVMRGRDRVGFEVARYDPTRPLVIDPVLEFSTYYGGTGNDVGRAIAVDGAGNAYVTGYTDSADFPAVSPLQGSLRGSSYDVVVVKIAANGSRVLYATYLGGDGNDYGYGIGVDAEGNAYVAGATFSGNFPMASAFQNTRRGPRDAFLAKLSPSGSALGFSTYLGGGDDDEAMAVAVDSSGSAYLTGWTRSRDFPTARPFQGTSRGSGDAFVTKFNRSGSTLEYSTYLGSTGVDYGAAIAVDQAGNAYVTGSTNSFNGGFPTVNALQSRSGGMSDAFVTKLNPAGSAPVYSTYLGSSNNDSGTGIAVDAAGHAYVIGSNSWGGFPTHNPFLEADCCVNAFLSKLSPAGSSFVYSSYAGGGGTYVNGIALDSAGNVHITGYNITTRFPTVRPLQACVGVWCDDAIVMKINSAGTSIFFASPLGGSGIDVGTSIAVDGAGNAWIAGVTGASSFPTTSGAPQRVYRGGHLSTFAGEMSGDMFISKITGLSDTTPEAKVVSAASGLGTSLVPESFATAYGKGLATRTEVAATVPFPTSLAGTVVTITDSGGAELPAPLYSVTAEQVNFIVPRETRTGPANLKITAGDGQVTTATVQIETVAPGLFSANGDGKGVAAAYATRLRADGSQTTDFIFEWDAAKGLRVASPVDLGLPSDQVVLVLFGTGFRFRSDLSAVKVKIGGVESEVLYAGPQGETPALDQVNVRLPRSLRGRDVVNIELTVDGKNANVVTVYVGGRPRVTSIAPSKLRVGESINNLTITGADLAEVDRLEFSPSEGVTISNVRATDTSVTAQVSLASTAAFGERTMRVATPGMKSDDKVFVFLPRAGLPTPFIYNATVRGSGVVPGPVTLTGSFEFEDGDGDIVTPGARITYWIGFHCSFTFSGPYLDKRGQTAGRVEFTYTYTPTRVILFTTESISIRLTDAAGRESNSVNTGGYLACP